MNGSPFFLIACCLLYSNGFAQKSHSQKLRTKPSEDYYYTQNDWYKSKTGKRINIDTPIVSIDGKRTDFHHLQHPAFVNFGFAGCPPCAHELPFYIEAATLHPEVDFVYITYDDETTRQQEFSTLISPDFIPNKNYYIIHMEQSEINRRDLTLGYPTKYFIDKNGIVQYVTSGGNVQEEADNILARITKLIAGEKVMD